MNYQSRHCHQKKVFFMAIFVSFSCSLRSAADPFAEAKDKMLSLYEKTKVLYESGECEWQEFEYNLDGALLQAFKGKSIDAREVCGQVVGDSLESRNLHEVAMILSRTGIPTKLTLNHLRFNKEGWVHEMYRDASMFKGPDGKSIVRFYADSGQLVAKDAVVQIGDTVWRRGVSGERFVASQNNPTYDFPLPLGEILPIVGVPALFQPVEGRKVVIIQSNEQFIDVETQYLEQGFGRIRFGLRSYLRLLESKSEIVRENSTTHVFTLFWGGVSDSGEKHHELLQGAIPEYVAMLSYDGEEKMPAVLRVRRFLRWETKDVKSEDLLNGLNIER